MGLDTVETVLWAEKEFGIDIPDADAVEIRKVGEFSIFIHRQLVLATDSRRLPKLRCSSASCNF